MHIPSSTGYSPTNYAIYELLNKYKHCTEIEIDSNILQYDRYQLASYVVKYMTHIPLTQHVGLDKLSLVRLLRMINNGPIHINNGSTTIDSHIFTYLMVRTSRY